MNKDIVKILSRIEGKLDKRLDGIEKRISTLEGGTKKNSADISEIYKILQKLSLDKNVVLKQDNFKCALDKSAVYKELDKQGINKSDLRLLKDLGILVGDKENHTTRVVRNNGNLQRVIIFKNK